MAHLITKDDILDTVQTSASDFSDNKIEESIAIAESRYMRLMEITTLPASVSAEHKKAITLLAIQEIATGVNLFWRSGDQAGNSIIRVKDLALDIDRLLQLSSGISGVVSSPLSTEESDE